MANEQPTRIAVAGLGSIGRRHARLISERDDTELLLCDPVAQHVTETRQDLHREPIDTFCDFDRALEAAPDLVFVCVPNHLHVPLGLTAIEAGADLMVEKPISDRVPEGRRLVEAAQAAGRFLHVGYMLRFDQGLLLLKHLIADGAVGQIAGGRAMVGSYITLLNARSPDRITQPDTLVTDYTHELDFIRWVFGEARRVAAVSSVRGALELRASPNIFQMNLTMASGALVQVHMDYIQHPQRRIFEVYGDRGTLVYDLQSGEIQQFRFGTDYEWQTHKVPDFFADRDERYRDQLASILQRRRAGQPAVVSGADALKTLAVAEAAIQAADSGRSVDVV